MVLVVVVDARGQDPTLEVLHTGRQRLIAYGCWGCIIDPSQVTRSTSVKTKFTDDEVRDIRGPKMAHLNAREVASLHGCCAETVRKVRRRETFNHIAEVRPMTQQMADEALAKLMKMQEELYGAGPEAKEE